jgi:UDP-N-acetylglucosamine/UDP-N-acetylgalactosamine diphosphorylase
MNASDIKTQELIKRGVTIRNPAAVDIDESVDVTRIARGVVIHQGCRIWGESTSIGPGCVLGEEGPVTVDNCQLSDKVVLKGGYFSGAVFLSGAVVGSCAHVRSGTLLEEQASCAHGVGLKQTVLMPYVALGSIINFCDCLMAGGTSRQNHSEVGSSYIHFNFTPYQDKVTASLIGDVARGVMLNQHPIFLGGQGGMVGPSRIEYGTVVAAGTICRKDVKEQDTLVVGGAGRSLAARSAVAFEAGAYGDISRILKNSFIYVGNLHALLQWYIRVRSKFMLGNRHDEACHNGALFQIKAMIGERVKRLGELAEKMPGSIEVGKRKSKGKLGQVYSEQRRFMERWPELASKLEAGTGGGVSSRERDILISEIDRLRRGATYLDAIGGLPEHARAAGTAWLQSIVDSVAALW